MIDLFAPIHKKILIASVLPMALALLIMGAEMKRQWSEISNLESINFLLELDVPVNELINEIQKERGLSAIFLGQYNKVAVHELVRQQQLTDQKAKYLFGLMSNIENNEVYSERGRSIR